MTSSFIARFSSSLAFLSWVLCEFLGLGCLVAIPGPEESPRPVSSSVGGCFEMVSFWGSFNGEAWGKQPPKRFRRPTPASSRHRQSHHFGFAPVCFSPIGLCSPVLEVWVQESRFILGVDSLYFPRVFGGFLEGSLGSEWKWKLPLDLYIYIYIKNKKKKKKKKNTNASYPSQNFWGPLAPGSRGVAPGAAILSAVQDAGGHPLRRSNIAANMQQILAIFQKGPLQGFIHLSKNAT